MAWPRFAALQLLHLKWFKETLILINVLSFFAGIVFWYGSQLPDSPIWFWPFIPDCPQFALMFAIVLLSWLVERRWYLFEVVTAYGLILYGTWTVFVWVVYWSQTGDYHAISLVMAASHVGLAAQGIMLLPALRITIVNVGAAIGWFCLSAFVDYGLGYHPALPRLVSLDLVRNQTLLMTGLLAVLFILMLVASDKRAATAGSDST
jgi:uncharacterized membrane protein YpjA